MWSLHENSLFQIATGINSLVTELAQGLKSWWSPLAQLAETAANTNFETWRGLSLHLISIPSERADDREGEVQVQRPRIVAEI